MFDVAAWSNEPILPGVSVADAGKVIAVDANGELEAVPIPVPEVNHLHILKCGLYGGGTDSPLLVFYKGNTAPSIDEFKQYLTVNGYISTSNLYPFISGGFKEDTTTTGTTSKDIEKWFITGLYMDGTTLRARARKWTTKFDYTAGTYMSHTYVDAGAFIINSITTILSI